jgi:hypothetical protein
MKRAEMEKFFVQWCLTDMILNICKCSFIVYILCPIQRQRMLNIRLFQIWWCDSRELLYTLYLVHPQFYLFVLELCWSKNLLFVFLKVPIQTVLSVSISIFCPFNLCRNNWQQVLHIWYQNVLKILNYVQVQLNIT